MFKTEKLRRGCMPQCPALPEGRFLSLFGTWGSGAMAFPSPASRSEVAICAAASFRERGRVRAVIALPHGTLGACPGAGPRPGGTLPHPPLPLPPPVLGKERGLHNPEVSLVT